MARGFTGPVLVPTLVDVRVIRDALYGRRDAEALDLIRRCDAVLEALHARRGGVPTRRLVA